MSDAFKLPVSVLVVVYSRDGQVLLLSRVHPAGFWQSVTGSLEPGENPAGAARRELAEETGIVAMPTDRRQYTDFPISARWRPRYAAEVDTNREHVFTLELPVPVTATLDPAEHTDSVWVPRDEALERVFSPTNRSAIETFVPFGPPGSAGPRMPPG